MTSTEAKKRRDAFNQRTQTEDRKLQTAFLLKTVEETPSCKPISVHAYAEKCRMNQLPKVHTDSIKLGVYFFVLNPGDASTTDTPSRKRKKMKKRDDIMFNFLIYVLIEAGNNIRYSDKKRHRIKSINGQKYDTAQKEILRRWLFRHKTELLQKDGMVITNTNFDQKSDILTLTTLQRSRGSNGNTDNTPFDEGDYTTFMSCCMDP